MKLTLKEQMEVHNQLLAVGQLVGMSWRINTELLEKWLKSEGERDSLIDEQEKFKYGKQVLAAIKFVEDSRL